MTVYAPYSLEISFLCINMTLPRQYKRIIENIQGKG